MADEPVDITLELTRRKGSNLEVGPQELLRLALDDIRREGLTGSKMIILFLEGPEQKMFSWRCGLVPLEEIGTLECFKVRLVLNQGETRNG